MARKFIKTRSNYVLKGVTQKIDGGTIFERDFMTISGAKGYSPNERPLYNESNFKFVTRSGVNLQKKHKQGEWLTNDVCEGDPTLWTLNCLSGELSKDAKLEINPDYESIRDFAYYGSAVDLVRASIVDIINRFPAELYFTDIVYMKQGNNIYYLIENPFEIDVDTEGINEMEVINPTRYMSVSFGDYLAFRTISSPEDETGLALKSWNIKSNNKTICPGDTEGYFVATATTEYSSSQLTIFVYYKEGKKYLLYTTKNNFGLRIRPNKERIEGFFNGLDDFEKILLNRDTLPIYTASFITPYETTTGIYSQKKQYTWPLLNNWNLDITSLIYAKYIDSLIALATFHDEIDTDNIWRSMTHEAIKNLDWTYTKQVDNEVEEMETLDTSRVEPILKLYGRQYDDIKRYIDNIRYINNITYNKLSNIPDYFISDALGLSGWDVKVLNPSFSESDNVTITYPSRNSVVTPAEANIEFMRRLKINSKALLSMKGTRKGVKSMLALMGFEEGHMENGSIVGGDYVIEENVVIAKPTSGGYPNSETAVEYNTLLYDEDNPGLKKLPVAYVGGENESSSYLIPWYDQEEKYAGDFYFQMKGGWGLRPKDGENATKCKKISYYSEEDGRLVTKWLTNEFFDVYTETTSMLKVVNTISEMFELGPTLVGTNDVCYVNDICDFETYFGTLPEQKHISHYFGLIDGIYWYTPYNEEKQELGWRYVENRYINPEIEAGEETLLKFGKRILYLESIIDNNDGNNPHIGNNNYDNGESYIKNLLKPFTAPLAANSNARYLDDSEKEAMQNFGWNGEKIVDNKKCWYFTDENVSQSAWKVCKETEGISKLKEHEQPETQSDFNLDILNEAYSPEKGKTGEHSEDASFSVVNVKDFKITFYVADDNNKSITQYIDDKVMFYVSQMVPSTALLSWLVIDENERPGGIPMDYTQDAMAKTRQIEGMIYTINDVRDGADFSEDVKVVSTSK